MWRIQNEYFPTLPIIQVNKLSFLERIRNKQTLDNKTKRRCSIYLSMRSNRSHLFQISIFHYLEKIRRRNCCSKSNMIFVRFFWYTTCLLFYASTFNILDCLLHMGYKKIKNRKPLDQRNIHVFIMSCFILKIKSNVKWYCWEFLNVYK